MKKANYKLTITQRGAAADKDLHNVFESASELEAFKKLASCYRDINRAERAPSITRARHWVRDAYNEDGRVHCFEIVYDVHMDGSVFTIYNWEFAGVD